MTRSHKQNDRDHVGLANGTAGPEEHLPRFFAKAGGVAVDPKSTKKNGSGKGNWGRQGDELEDYSYNMTKPRRRSNSFSTAAGHVAGFANKTKFETIEAEPVFEEELHGPSAADFANDNSEDGYELDKASSAGSGSIVGEDAAIEEKK